MTLNGRLYLKVREMLPSLLSSSFKILKVYFLSTTTQILEIPGNFIRGYIASLSNLIGLKFNVFHYGKGIEIL